MSPLQTLLNTYREMAQTEREKGLYFELLIKSYLENDPKYDFEKVWLWSDWAKEQGISGQDDGIDLVAQERDNGGVWAVQCKFYSDDVKIYKKHIDSFFTASGKNPFSQRLIVLSNDKLSSLATQAMENQQVPCASLYLADLEESPIDWSSYQPGLILRFKAKKTLLPHQEKALTATIDKLKEKDRGKLLMACGTGKTFTSLKIAEQMAGAGQMALFLVPSLSLLSQALTEWTAESVIPLRSFAVCSDGSTGRRVIKGDDDLADIKPSDLAYPATTNAKKLAEKVAVQHPEKMTVLFSTYQSLAVISEAQKKYGLGEFSLIICDEAHRTTGVTLAGDDESSFVKVHDNNFLKAKKRIYMTATPRVFGDVVKSKAQDAEAVLCSMDDESLYGETLYCINFTEAVYLGLLSDYKVLVLAVDEEHISQRVQKMLADEDGELKLDDATKIIGCWKALSKEKLEVPDDPHAMKRAVAFCRDIKNSKKIEQFFREVVEEYLHSESLDDEVEKSTELSCELVHVDGTMSSATRKKHIEWLKEDTTDLCRILTNARCLSEGVDVPALDSVLFFNPRKSQVDVVQAVGRVMRKTADKRRGYVILPIGVPSGVSAEEALADNEKYRVVWQILQALRSHDDNFDDFINKIDLGVDVSSKMEVIAVTNTFKAKKDDGGEKLIGGRGPHGGDGDDAPVIDLPTQNKFKFDIGEFEKAIYAKIVKKCGNRQYWEEWAGDIAKIAQTHITRITAVLKDKNNPARPVFDAFLAEIRDDLNDSISEEDTIEMLAQHIITKPVFDALFEDYSFAANNPVSLALQRVLDVLGEEHLEKEADSLEKFYESVKRRAKNIDNAQAKQKIVVELYDKFFRNAFPKMTERLGIVYTPVEIVDFIIHSVNDILQNEFGQSLASENVHIIDPFTGTGTFITRLMQSGLIDKKNLPRKYLKEIHANEIVLLAYYIAAINIESVYHGLVGGAYKPFEGICLTDTFQLYEKEDLISDLMEDNSARRKRQKKLDIRVIFGNPPYSAGQKSENDNNQNIGYPALDERIRATYAKYSTATLQKNLYDSYIRAIRWASDRIGNSGVIGFVTNASFIDGNAMDGLRKCLIDEFSSLYIFHLRGNQRTSGELSRKEGGKIFGGGSRAPIAITLFVKNNKMTKPGRLYFYDIGDYLIREEKLNIVADFKSTANIGQKNLWRKITPDKHNDWLDQRDDSFEKYISLGNKKNKNQDALFKNYSQGLLTSRDAWL